MNYSQQTSATPTLNVIDIIHGTSVDGPGLRSTVYFAGCDHHCPGCHNPQSWAHDSGQEMGIDELAEILIAEELPVTFSGGDPILQVGNLILLAERIRKAGLGIWCYTGFHYETLAERPDCRRLLSLVDVVVDGPFIEKERDIKLLFKGSANQRLIDVKKTMACGTIQLWESGF